MVDYIKAWKEKQALIQSIKAEITRMKDYLDVEVKRQGSIEKSLRFALEARETESIDYGIHSLALHKCPPSLPVEIDDGLVPDAFWLEIPSARRVDRALLLKAVKARAIKEIKLVTDKKRLKIS